MAKVITFSRVFPSYHAKKGQPTYFVEKFWNSIQQKEFFINYYSITDYNKGKEKEARDFWKSIQTNYTDHGLKNHTIRAGNRFKKGDYFSPRVWSGRPYNSKQIVIAPDTLITDAWNVVIEFTPGAVFVMLTTEIHTQFQLLSVGEVAGNDGLEREDLERWFNPKKNTVCFEGQIICWNPNIKY